MLFFLLMAGLAGASVPALQCSCELELYGLLHALAECWRGAEPRQRNGLGRTCMGASDYCVRQDREACLRYDAPVIVWKGVVAVEAAVALGFEKRRHFVPRSRNVGGLQRTLANRNLVGPAGLEPATRPL